MKAHKIRAYTDSRNATSIQALFVEKDEYIYIHKVTKPPTIKLCLHYRFTVTVRLEISAPCSTAFHRDGLR